MLGLLFCSLQILLHHDEFASHLPCNNRDTLISSTKHGNMVKFEVVPQLSTPPPSLFTNLQGIRFNPQQRGMKTASHEWR
jgi:hypothetical protein